MYALYKRDKGPSYIKYGRNREGGRGVRKGLKGSVIMHSLNVVGRGKKGPQIVVIHYRETRRVVSGRSTFHFDPR